MIYVEGTNWALIRTCLNILCIIWKNLIAQLGKTIIGCSNDRFIIMFESLI